LGKEVLTSHVSSPEKGLFTRRSQQLIYVMDGPPTIRKRESAREGGNFAFESGVISGLLEKKSMLMMVMRKEVVG